MAFDTRVWAPPPPTPLPSNAQQTSSPPPNPNPDSPFLPSPPNRCSRPVVPGHRAVCAAERQPRALWQPRPLLDLHPKHAGPAGERGQAAALAGGEVEGGGRGGGGPATDRGTTQGSAEPVLRPAARFHRGMWGQHFTLVLPVSPACLPIPPSWPRALSDALPCPEPLRHSLLLAIPTTPFPALQRYTRGTTCPRPAHHIHPLSVVPPCPAALHPLRSTWCASWA